MKSLHRPDLFAWSRFDEARNIDFNTFVWVRPDGNVVFDPLPVSSHDIAHLRSLGRTAWIVVTNSDHVRSAHELAGSLGAKIAAPAGEQGIIDLAVDRWLADGDELVPGLRAYAMNGSKTPGELAFHVAPDTVVTGDLVRSHRPGHLHLLAPDKLTNAAAALASARRLAEIPGVTAVLVGDGWCVFENGAEKLRAIAG
jgi:hypothetical protein